MKKFILKLKHNTLFGIIIGILISCGIVYGVNTYESGAIKYSPTDSSWEVDNVNDAINSLYSMKNELDSTTTSLNSLKAIGDATAAQILSGKKAVVKGNTVTGTMTNRGAVTSTLNAGGSYTIPAGYHNGSGKVTVNTLASQTSATATAAQILSGKTAYVNGSKITGTMTNRGAVTSTLNAGGSYTIPAGYHNGSGKVTVNTLASQTSATATASDIKSGKTAWVNGTKLTGTMTSGATYLGTTSGGTFDCTGISGYKNLTANNFLLVLTSIPMNKSRIEKTVWNSTAQINAYSLNKAYNASTGKLTYTSVLSFLVSVQNSEGYHDANNSTVLTFDVYLIA